MLNLPLGSRTAVSTFYKKAFCSRKSMVKSSLFSWSFLSVFLEFYLGEIGIIESFYFFTPLSIA